VRLSWAPEHIHVVKDSSAPVAAAQEGGPE
jgi:hypothetical protein